MFCRQKDPDRNLLQVHTFAKHRFLKEVSTTISTVTTGTSAADSIAIAKTYAKGIYDRNHKPLQMEVEDWTILRLRKGHQIPSTVVLGRKLSQQYVGSFKFSIR